eukprot:jgi/Ulvmu1/5004/UM021_0021.1
MISYTLLSLREFWQSGSASHLWQGCIYQRCLGSHVKSRGPGRSVASSVFPAVPEHVIVDSSAVQETSGQFLRVCVHPGACLDLHYLCNFTTAFTTTICALPCLARSPDSS